MLRIRRPQASVLAICGRPLADGLLRLALGDSALSERSQRLAGTVAQVSVREADDRDVPAPARGGGE